jgi:hypothetical protein
MHRSAEPSPLHTWRSTCIAWLNVYAVCLLNIRSIEQLLHYSTYTLHLNRVTVLVLFSFELVDMSLYKLKPLWICDMPKLNYALQSHCLFTLPLHWQCSWGRCHVNTDWQQLHTTTPLGVYLKCVLSLRRLLPFNTGGLRRTDGQTDGRTKIA